MALSLKISWFLTASEPAEVEIEPSWWRIKDLLNTYDFSQISIDGYRDWELSVSRETLRLIHLQQKSHAFEGSFAYKKWRKINQSQIDDIEIMLDSPLRFDRIVIRIFEWESNL